MKKELICLGEILIDFMCQETGSGLKEGETFLKKAGGAPANVAAVAARLGVPAAFAGCVGVDPFGDFLVESVEHFGVDTSMVTRVGTTTMAFVSIMADGERDFVFARGADAHYDMQGHKARYRKAGVLHLGSATALLGGKTGEAYEAALALAEEAGVFVSFDPNYRTDLWKGAEDVFIRHARAYAKRAQFLKLSDAELMLIYGGDTLEEGLDRLFQEYQGVAAITLGSKGTYLVTPAHREIVPSIPIKPVDTTGAGDAFVGAFLAGLLQEDSLEAALNDMDRLKALTREANAVAAKVCTRMGAMTSLEVIEPRRQGEDVGH